MAQGFSQQPGLDFDEVFSPVVRYDSLRLLLALTAHHHWRPQQLDIKCAFLYGILKEEIYMQLPEGSRQDGMCAKLNRCIYGLKQSPREWYQRLIDYLVPYGFSVSTFDPCVLVHSHSQPFFIAIYVDDITLFGPPGNLMDSTKDLLKLEFQVTDMGDLHWLLGMQIEYFQDHIAISQTAYIDKILHRFGLHDANPVNLPLDANHTLIKGTDDTRIPDTKLYQQMVGSLMYAVTGTRPDLVFTVTLLSQFLSCPTKFHLGAAKRVLRYLKGTRHLKLLFPYGMPLALEGLSGKQPVEQQPPLVLEGLSDSDYAGCRDTRRSTSGYIFRLANMVALERFFFFLFIFYFCIAFTLSLRPALGQLSEVWDGGGLFFLSTRCCIKMLCMVAISRVKKGKSVILAKGRKLSSMMNSGKGQEVPSSRSGNKISKTDKKASRHRSRIKIQTHKHR